MISMVSDTPSVSAERSFFIVFDAPQVSLTPLRTGDGVHFPRSVHRLDASGARGRSDPPETPVGDVACRGRRICRPGGADSDSTSFRPQMSGVEREEPPPLAVKLADTLGAGVQPRGDLTEGHVAEQSQTNRPGLPGGQLSQGGADLVAEFVEHSKAGGIIGRAACGKADLLAVLPVDARPVRAAEFSGASEPQGASTPEDNARRKTHCSWSVRSGRCNPARAAICRASSASRDRSPGLAPDRRAAQIHKPRICENVALSPL
jgi:hypothetical protein